jgi:YebC/PmpR family DNA-binding regulatory protein
MASSAQARAKRFTKLARELMVSARNGSDPETNSALRLAIDKAKASNMPKDNIERAIKKGSGELKGQNFETVIYEGYGPKGTALIIETLTDNKKRTTPSIKVILQKNQGHLGEIGSVAWIFQKKGILLVSKENASEEKLMDLTLDIGAEDIVLEDENFSIYSSFENFSHVKDSLTKNNIPLIHGDIELLPENFVELDEENYEVAMHLIEKLEEHEDVQKVYHNCICKT